MYIIWIPFYVVVHTLCHMMLCAWAMLLPDMHLSSSALRGIDHTRACVHVCSSFGTVSTCVHLREQIDAVCVRLRGRIPFRWPQHLK